MDSGVSVVIPAYNEEGGLKATVDEIREALTAAALPHEIVIVDDGSTDGTAAVAAEIAGVRVLRNNRNRGYGASLKRGIDAAKFPVVAITDADGTYPGDAIPSLVEMLTDDVDMVVGWRKGYAAKIPLIRRPAKWVMRKFAESMAASPIPDLNSGLRVFRRDRAQRYRATLPEGFSFTTTITLLVLSEGGAIVYEPIGYRRREGASKFRPVRDAVNMAGLIVRSILLFNPLRVFAPIALGFLGLAAFVLLFSYMVLGRILDATVVILFVTGIHFLFLGFLADLINRRSMR